MAAAISPGLQKLLSNLYAKLTTSLADIDYEEQAKRRLYDQNIHTSGLDREKSMVGSSVNMADRGLNRSGIALQDQVNVGNAYDSKNAGFAQSFDSDLASVARRRLAAESDYNLGKADLEAQSVAQTPVSFGGGGSGGGGGFGGGGGGSVPTPTNTNLPYTAPTGYGIAPHHDLVNAAKKKVIPKMYSGSGSAGGGGLPFKAV